MYCALQCAARSNMAQSAHFPAFSALLKSQPIKIQPEIQITEIILSQTRVYSELKKLNRNREFLSLVSDKISRFLIGLNSRMKREISRSIETQKKVPCETSDHEIKKVQGKSIGVIIYPFEENNFSMIPAGNPVDDLKILKFYMAISFYRKGIFKFPPQFCVAHNAPQLCRNRSQ